MSCTAFSRLQNLGIIIYPLRYIVRWLVPLLTSEQLISPQDAASRTNCLSRPFSRSYRCVQSTIQPQGIENEKISIGNLSRSRSKNILAFDENAPASFPRSTRLRIFREYDRNISSHCAGRMVISGRMKDVCAEIDRLASTKE